MDEPIVLELRDGDCAVVGDARSFPLVIVTWWGEPNEVIVPRYFAWSNSMFVRAEIEDTKVVIITDARKSKRPPATIRKLIAELTDASPTAASERSLANFLVLDSALVRGALTAMQWLSKRDWRVETVPDLETGIRAAVATLGRSGVPAPDIDPETYASPEPVE